MSDTFTELHTLATRYPRIFSQGEPDYGFQTGQGWSDLIENLCSYLDEILKKDPAAKMSVMQVKEKFGGLRFYYDLINASDDTENAVRDLVSEACKASESICEQCSLPATTETTNHWTSTLCERCRKEQAGLIGNPKT